MIRPITNTNSKLLYKHSRTILSKYIRVICKYCIYIHTHQIQNTSDNRSGMAKGLKTMCRFLTSWIQSRATSIVPVQDTLTITEGGMGHQKFVRGHMWPLGPHLAMTDRYIRMCTPFTCGFTFTYVYIYIQ